MNLEQAASQQAQEQTREKALEDVRRKITTLNEGLAALTARRDDGADMDAEAFENAKESLVADLYGAAETDPEAVLDLIDGVDEGQVRRGIQRGALVHLGAKGDSMAFEAAMEKYRRDLDGVWEPQAADGEVQKVRNESAAAQVEVLLRQDVPSAARALKRMPRSRERSEAEDAVAEALGGAVEKLLAEGRSDDAMALCRKMPDITLPKPASDAGAKIYMWESAAFPPDMPFEEKKKHLKERFKDNPDILARRTIDGDAPQNWTAQDRHELFTAVRDMGDRKSVLALVRVSSFGKENIEGIKRDLFDAYREHNPANLLDGIDSFQPEYADLPEAERRRLKGAWIAESPIRTMNRAKYLDLDGDERFKLIDTLVKGGPEYFVDDPGRRKRDAEALQFLGLNEALLVERATALGQSARVLKQLWPLGAVKPVENRLAKNEIDASGGLSRETRAALLNDIAARDPETLCEKFATGVKAVGVAPEAARKGLLTMLAKSDYEGMRRFERMTGTRFEVSALSGDELRRIKLSDIDAVVRNWPEARSRLAWADIAAAGDEKGKSRLEKLQGRAARKEHDTWKTDLDPLAADAFARGVLSPEKGEDAEIFLGFVKEFGASDTPKLLETFAGLKRAKNIEEIPEGVRRLLEDTLGPKRVAKMKTPAFLLNELRKFDRAMVGTLLKDEVPSGLVSELGLELFDQKKGASAWDRNDDARELIAAWERFRDAHPEAARVPEGYKEASFDVPMAGQRSRMPEIAAVLEGGGLRDAFNRYRAAFAGVDELRTHLPPSGSIAFQELMELEAVGPLLDGEPVVGAMERLAKQDAPEEDRVLFAASVRQIMHLAPPAFAETIDRITHEDPDAALEAEHVDELRNLLVDWVSEHYLHPSQEAHHVGHTPFPPELREKLARLWGVDDLAANPIVQAFEGIEAAKRRHMKASGKKKGVALVPAQGLLRVYGGDLGDACYSSRHRELADGVYPDLHAMVFVTGRGTANERFAGSVLFVETETPSRSGGEKVLVVRANNPRENLIQSVDANALVKATLDEAIATAKRRGLDRVVVPLDAASNSSSNRPAVAAYYHENFRGGERLPLVREPETAFNGYDNWRAGGDHGVVVIWSRTEEGV